MHQTWKVWHLLPYIWYYKSYKRYFGLNANYVALWAIYLELKFSKVLLTQWTCPVDYVIHIIMLCGCCFCYAILSPGTSWCTLHGCITQQSNPDCKGLFGWRSCSARLYGSHTEITRTSHCQDQVYNRRTNWFNQLSPINNSYTCQAASAMKEQALF